MTPKHVGNGQRLGTRSCELLILQGSLHDRLRKAEQDCAFWRMLAWSLLGVVVILMLNLFAVGA